MKLHIVLHNFFMSVYLEKNSKLKKLGEIRGECPLISPTSYW